MSTPAPAATPGPGPESHGPQSQGSQSQGAQSHESRHHTLLHRWPAALGLLAAAVSLSTGTGTAGPAITVSVAALCYLGAAALNRRWVAWAGIPAGTLVVIAAEFAGLAWWIAVGAVAVALVVLGLVTRVRIRMVTPQAAALLGFGGLAVAALFLAPRAGLVLAGAALAAHAGWDLVHYRRDIVVPRSLAEFCMLLDVPLGLGCVLIALLS